MNTTTVPITEKYTVDVDFFSRESLTNPYDGYRRLRDAGPLAYMPKYDMWIATRYDEVKRILGDHETFCSGEGIGLNNKLNEAWHGIAAASDGEPHAAVRRVMMRGLGPRAVQEYRPLIEAKAKAIVDRVLELGEFDAVKDFAIAMPTGVVVDIMGLDMPQDEREHLLHLATDSYNCTGPDGTFDDTWAANEEIYNFAVSRLTPDHVRPGSLGAQAWEAVAEGQLTPEQGVTTVLGYATAGLDTTAGALGSLMMLLSQHPDQYALLAESPDLVSSAILEGVRVESPAQWFSRVTTTSVEFDDIELDAGTRVMHSYAAANRDERHYDDPARFDVTRNPIDLLGFGYGSHGCMGKNLSNLESNVLLTEFISRVESIEPAGEPVRHVNNLIRSLSSLPVRVTAK